MLGHMPSRFTTFVRHSVRVLDGLIVLTLTFDTVTSKPHPHYTLTTPYSLYSSPDPQVQDRKITGRLFIAIHYVKGQPSGRHRDDPLCLKARSEISPSTHLLPQVRSLSTSAVLHVRIEYDLPHPITHHPDAREPAAAPGTVRCRYGW